MILHVCSVNVLTVLPWSTASCVCTFDFVVCVVCSVGKEVTGISLCPCDVTGLVTRLDSDRVRLY